MNRSAHRLLIWTLLGIVAACSGEGGPADSTTTDPPQEEPAGPSDDEPKADDEPKGPTEEQPGPAGEQPTGPSEEQPGPGGEQPTGPSEEQPTGPSEEHPSEPGNAIEVAPSSVDQQAFDSLSTELRTAQQVTAADLSSAHSLPFETLAYDPAQAEYLDLIQASSLALNDEELAMLSNNGFVISARHGFPTFGYGYVTLYMEDLPVYVSADSILETVHRSYDKILERIEQEMLIPELDALLSELRAALPSVANEVVRADLDFYLTVAHSLLQGSASPPSAGASAQQVTDFFNLAEAADGTEGVSLFGVDRSVDLSQFEPRGHYTDTEQLQRYFRAMMWLGRIDFRLLETQGDGSQVFHRRQYDATVALGALFGEQQLERFERIDNVIEAFVGEPDNMTLPEVSNLLTDLGGPEAAATASDEAVARAIVDGGYGAQRIASHLVVKTGAGDTLPLNRSFLIFGQRYVLDSHVFSNVVWDRVEAQRMMPDPLDVAFAALGNDAALPLLDDELTTYSYAGNLNGVRLLADSHDDAFWGANLYNLWLDSLRGMSAQGDFETGLPAVARTEPWSRRVLNTQLASWAELRHDTILYAKQSYTTGDSCEFPDGYVDPYPELYAALIRYAEKGEAIASGLPESDAQHYNGVESVPLAQGIAGYFANLRTIAEMLLEMAELQLDGLPYEQQHLDFLNRTVKWHPEQVCGAPPQLEGWYADLFFYVDSASEFDPTIADVHTQPTEPGGAPVGKVLHVGTGNAELMVVTIDTCSGPKAYAGLASSYYEHITRDFERLTDDDWAEIVHTNPPRVPWLSGVLAE